MNDWEQAATDASPLPHNLHMRPPGRAAWRVEHGTQPPTGTRVLPRNLGGNMFAKALRDLLVS